jgi:hypothetical protein
MSKSIRLISGLQARLAAMLRGGFDFQPCLIRQRALSRLHGYEFEQKRSWPDRKLGFEIPVI